MPRVAEPEPLPVAQARAGDAGAWSILFKRYRLPLYAYVFELARNEQTALDIVQETFIAAVRHIGGLRDDAKFSSWLFGIAHQKCVEQWRRRGRDGLFSDELIDQSDDGADGPVETLLRAEQEAGFFHLLEQLPTPQRSVLLLYFIEDFSLDDIARVTGAPLGTVKSRMHHAKLAFKKLWEENRQ